MLIIGKNRDYYDSATAHGVDKKVVYNRHRKILKKYTKFICGSHDVRWPNRHESNTSFWIGFCGVWYYGYAAGASVNQLIEYGATKDKVCYGDEAIKLSHTNEFSYFGRYLSAGLKSARELHGSTDRSLFLELDTPVIAVVDNWAIVNPVLGNFCFQKIKDSFSAFQEIEMFLTNDLVKQVDPAPLSDRDRAKAHGFDKWSFRKDTPPTRKNK